jgi:hemolysin activation/secretion protein
VPNFPQVQQQLAALARSPDRKVTPVLKPGSQPGAVDVELKVEDQLPLHGAIELNNRNSINTEPLRAQASLRYDNLWQRGHSISGLVQTAPQDPQQSQVYAATYVMPLDAAGDSLALYAVRSKSNVAAVGDATVIGNGYIIGARALVPLTPLGRYNHTFTAGLDYKSFQDNVALAGETIETPVSYVPLLLQYGASYFNGRSSTQGSLGLNFAPRGVFVNDDTEFENKRYNAQLSYVYLRAALSHERALLPKLRLGVRLTGQVADQPLISNEQFAAGGADSVRGYYEAQALGDTGLQASIQLSSTSLFGSAEGAVDEVLAFAFVDGATLWVIDALPGQQSRFDLASVGLGLSLRAWHHLDALVDLAVPLIDATEIERGDPRVSFRVAYEF